LPLWSELEAEWGSPLREWHGSLDLGHWAADRRALAACGAAFEVLERGEIERRFPLRVAAGERGLFQPDAGIVLADEALRALRGGAEAAGARVVDGTRVDSLEQETDAIRIGQLRARAVVITAGAWASRLVELDVTPTRETVTYFRFGDPIPSLIDHAVGDAFGRLGYALFAPGVGVKAGLHHTGPRVNPDDPARPDEEIVARAASWVKRRVRGVDPEPVKVETCLYTNRLDERFVLERRGRVVVGSACSGHGFKFAPLVGVRLADLALRALSSPR